MKTLMVDEETCQECADFLSLVEALTWPAIDPTLLDKKPTGPTPSEQAAERLGYEPFSYNERS